MAMPRWRRSDVAFGCVAGCLWVAILLAAAEPKRPRSPPPEWMSAADWAAAQAVLDADGEDDALRLPLLGLLPLQDAGCLTHNTPRARACRGAPELPRRARAAEARPSCLQSLG
jgi:hypothetical protein